MRYTESLSHRVFVAQGFCRSNTLLPTMLVRAPLVALVPTQFLNVVSDGSQE